MTWLWDLALIYLAQYWPHILAATFTATAVLILTHDRRPRP